MISQSGCFGNSNEVVDVIDDTAEAAQAVSDIIGTVQGAEAEAADVAAPTVFALSLVYKRLRMLTWAVVIIAIYLLVKGTK